jgi:hypothetical protein
VAVGVEVAPADVDVLPAQDDKRTGGVGGDAVGGRRVGLCRLAR